MATPTALRAQTTQPVPAPLRPAGATRAPRSGARSELAQTRPPAVRLSPSIGARSPAGLPVEVADVITSPGSGSALPSTIKAALETSLEVPLHPVRVHTDARAAAAVDRLGARAFTYGLHIFLGSREQATDLPLMAHEVAHVVQQQGGPIIQTHMGETSGDAFEQEARQTATTVQRGEHATVRRRTGGQQVQGIWPVDELVGFVEGRAWSLLNEYAPELVPIIRQGPLEWLKDKIASAVETVFNTLMAPVREVTGIVQSLQSHFALLMVWMREAAEKIARGDCRPFTEAAEKIQQVVEGIASPIIDRIKHLVGRVKGFFTGLWDEFGAPAWQWLQRMGGLAWERIQQFGRWVWEKTAPVRRIANQAWIWTKNRLGIGEGPEGHDGIIQWVQRKAAIAWDQHIKPFIERHKRPLMVVGSVLLLLSPAGPIFAIGAAVGGLIVGVRWIRQHMTRPNGVVEQRGVLHGTIIPAIMGAVNRVSAFLTEKAQFITTKLGEVMSGLGQAISAVAGTILRFVTPILQWIADRFRELVNWAQEKLMGLVNWVRTGFERLRIFLQPVLDVLGQIASVIGNIITLPFLLAGRLWSVIPACIRNPFINFFIPLILRQISFFRELVATPEAWEQTRSQVMDLIRQVFRDFDLMGAMRTAFRLVVRALNIPLELAAQVLEKGRQAWSVVVAAPLRFIQNALKAVLQGFGLFMRNFLSHLWHGVQGWLLNAVQRAGTSIRPPASWDFRGVFGFVLDVLGISLDHILELLARRVDRLVVARIRQAIRILTGVWEWVKVAIDEGPAGLWRMLVDRLGNLGMRVLEAAVGWVMTRIFAIVGARLTALAASGGFSGILEAVVAMYQAIQTAIEYARRILEILMTVFNTVVQIAQGVLGPAAAGVERGLRMAMPVVIGFLANYAGLGGIGGRIRDIILDVRERVDNAILALIDRALAVGRGILDRLRGGATPQERLTNAMQDAQRAVARFSGQRVGALILRPLLAALKLRYGLTSLDVFPRGGRWAIRGVINPDNTEDTSVLVGDDPATGEFIYEKAAGSNTDKVKKDLTVVRFPQQTPLTGSAAQVVLQSALESIVTREDLQYDADSLTRASHSRGHVPGVKDNEARASLSATGLPGYQPLDHRGHLVGDRFYGSNQVVNLVPMHQTLNLSSFKTYENTLATAFKTRKDSHEPVLLYMSVRPTFPGDDSTNSAHWRPTLVEGRSKIITLEKNSPTLTKHEEELNSGPLTNPDAVINDFYINSDDEAVMRALKIHPRLISAITLERSTGRFRIRVHPDFGADSVLDVIKVRLVHRLGDAANLLGQLDPLAPKIRL